MAGEKDRTLRILSLVVSCVGMMAGGIFRAYWTYAYTIKFQFNYTQSQIETISSLSNMGVSMGYPAGVLYEHIGPRWMSVVAMAINVSVFGILFSTTTMISFYHLNPWLQYIYFFLTGLGSICITITCLSTGIKNTSPKHRAKTIGILDTAYLLGSITFSAIYGIFSKGHTHDVENQNLGGYYLLTMAVFVVICTLCIIFLREFPAIVETTEEAKLIDLTDAENKKEPDVQDTSVFKLIRNLNFHFLFWAFVLSASIQTLVQNNQSIYLKSFNFEEYTTILTTVPLIPGIITEIAVGLASDKFLDKIPRSGFIFASSIAQTFVFIVSIFLSSNLVMFTFLDIIVGIANSFVFCLVSTLISEFYGTKYFARNWGFLLINYGTMTMLIQAIYGWIYESGITDNQSTDCYGKHCFTWSFVMCSVMSLCAAVCSFALFRNDMKARERGKLNFGKGSKLTYSSESSEAGQD